MRSPRDVVTVEVSRIAHARQVRERPDGRLDDHAAQVHTLVGVDLENLVHQVVLDGAHPFEKQQILRADHAVGDELALLDGVAGLHLELAGRRDVVAHVVDDDVAAALRRAVDALHLSVEHRECPRRGRSQASRTAEAHAASHLRGSPRCRPSPRRRCGTSSSEAAWRARSCSGRTAHRHCHRWPEACRRASSQRSWPQHRGAECS